MLLEVGTFCYWVENNLYEFIDALVTQTNFQGENHIYAWRKSPPQLSKALRDPRFSDFHIQVGEPGSLSIEYNLSACTTYIKLRTILALLKSHFFRLRAILIVEREPLQNWLGREKRLR